MKTIKEYINESLAGERAEKAAEKFLVKYHSDNALEFKKKLEKDGWTLDPDYDNWAAGETVTLRYVKGNETLHIEYKIDDNFDGKITDKSLEKLTDIEKAEYKK